MHVHLITKYRHVIIINYIHVWPCPIVWHELIIVRLLLVLGGGGVGGRQLLVLLQKFVVLLWQLIVSHGHISHPALLIFVMMSVASCTVLELYRIVTPSTTLPNFAKMFSKGSVLNLAMPIYQWLTSLQTIYDVYTLWLYNTISMHCLIIYVGKKYMYMPVLLYSDHYHTAHVIWRPSLVSRD